MLVASMGLSAQSVYSKVTTTPADWTGTYLIVCEGQSVVFNGAADEDHIDAKGGAAIISGVTITDGTIIGDETLDAATFTISATEDELWPWAIQSASGLYIGHKDSTVADNGLSTETELKGKCKHTLTIDTDGNLIATPKYSVGEAYNLQYNKKADQLRFRYFLPADKQAVQLYRLQSAPTAISNVGATERKVQKVVENGQVVIIREGVRYNAVGL